MLGKALKHTKTRHWLSSVAISGGSGHAPGVLKPEYQPYCREKHRSRSSVAPVSRGCSIVGVAHSWWPEMGIWAILLDFLAWAPGMDLYLKDQPLLAGCGSLWVDHIPVKCNETYSVGSKWAWVRGKSGCMSRIWPHNMC